VAVPIREWTQGVAVELEARKQLEATASLPIVWPHLAVMPDVHWGMGSTVGSVVPTRGAIIPACVGVDLGCGMSAVKTSLSSSALLDNGQALRDAIERAVPHGRTDDGGSNDRGAWRDIPKNVAETWNALSEEFEPLASDRPRLDTKRQPHQLGTLGTGNHFIEVCLDESDSVWVMLHSGSRSVGNRIGSTFIALAKDRCAKEGTQLPNSDLAWLEEGTPEFAEYTRAVLWAQKYAAHNRMLMIANTLNEIGRMFPEMQFYEDAVSCHHNYVSREHHFGEDLWITRKGAVSAKKGELGIIPGAMGRKSFIVRGLGNPDSFHTCSHGAGRSMSRGAARKTISIEDHAKDTEGVFCRKDEGVLDESPRAYKNINAVMAAQTDLVEVVHTLRAAICVKG
jgi:tRNA-splicing ligase RtcB (3'-phosphate/5'-hydroxy nucleic acid ligase)